MKINIIVFLCIVFSFCWAHTINNLGPGEIEIILNPNEVHSGCIQVLKEGDAFTNYKQITDDQGKEKIVYNYYIDLSNIDAQISDTIYFNLMTGNSLESGRVLLNNYQICNSGYCKNIEINAAKTLFNFDEEHFKHFLNYIENQPLRMFVTDMDLCVFYPELEINVDPPPTNITEDTNIILKGEIINLDQIDANKVTLNLHSEDFNIEPHYFKFDLTGNYNKDESVKAFEFILTPKNMNLENKILNGIYYGTLTYSFEDTQGVERTKSLDLGKASFSIMKEDIEKISSISKINIKDTEEQATEEVTEKDDYFSLIVGTLVVVILILVGIIYFLFVRQNNFNM